MVDSHDPLCPLESECPGRDRPHFIVEGDTWCGGCQIECQCILIAKIRTDERGQESARRAAKFGYWHDYRPELP